MEDEKKQYDLDCDPNTHQARNYKLFSCVRPHMRAFHLSWFSFLTAFLAWFSFAPLSPVIQESLNLTSKDVMIANICSVGSTIFARFLMGPVMDRVGPRAGQAGILLFAAVPTYFAGQVHSLAGFATIRALVGIVGAAFVGCQFWCTLMFDRSIVGTMNAIAGGWGNLGGGLTQIVMIGIFAMNKSSTCDNDCAWRNAFYIPATTLLISAGLVYFLGDDSPKGKYEYIPHIKSNTRKSIPVVYNRQVWLLAVQYAVCFGVELHINNIAVLYFYENFGVSHSTAGLVSSLFGLTNIFARPWGGMLSDKAHSICSTKGRKYTHIILTFCSGLSLITFSRMTSFSAAIGTMIPLSILVQCSSGSTFGIVPYVDPPNTGAICGIVGAGGNFGAVCWGFLFLGINNYSDGFMILGMIILGVSVFGLALNGLDDPKDRMSSNVTDKQADLELVQNEVPANTKNEAGPLKT